jgi:hypothetical protein|tara:strand:+ start:82 stop:231 length:150 start_codon:yes stop_codon:yes gene_type:complete
MDPNDDTVENGATKRMMPGSSIPQDVPLDAIDIAPDAAPKLPPRTDVIS